VNRSTGKSPFEIVYGIHPRGIIELRKLSQHEFRSVGAKEFTAEMHKLHDKVREQLDAGASPSQPSAHTWRREE
jgi:hypothetical protein